MSSELMEERLDRIENQLEDLLRELLEMRKEHRDRHKDVVRVLSSDAMRVATLLRRR